MPMLPSTRVLAEERNPEPLAVTKSVPPWLVKGFDTCGSGPPLNITSLDSNWARGANVLESLPSTLSALRLVTLVWELTFMGALPEATCKSSAVEPVAVEGLETCRAGPPPTVPVSLVMAVAVLFREPRMKWLALAPKAALATPTVRATITARPTINVAALPTSITFLSMLAICLPLPFLVFHYSVHYYSAWLMCLASTA